MSALQIFISHNHQDQTFCHALAQELRQAGADVWYDEHNLGAGHLRRSIEQELHHRQIFLLILSPASLASLWVQEETEWFYELYRQELRKSGTGYQLLPILLESVKEHDIPLFYRGFKRIAQPNGIPYPPSEAIQHTLKALGLPRPPKPAEPGPIQDTSFPGDAIKQEDKRPSGLPVSRTIKRRFLISLAVNALLTVFLAYLFAIPNFATDAFLSTSGFVLLVVELIAFIDFLRRVFVVTLKNLIGDWFIWAGSALLCLIAWLFIANNGYIPSPSNHTVAVLGFMAVMALFESILLFVMLAIIGLIKWIRKH